MSRSWRDSQSGFPPLKEASGRAEDREIQQVEVTYFIAMSTCLSKVEQTRLVLVFSNKLCSKSVKTILGES